MNVGAAIKDLRSRMGLTQNEFARLINKTLNTVTRYENQVKPGIDAVVVCGALARRAGYTDLATVFREAVVNTLGPEIEELMATESEGARVSSSVRVSKDMVPLVTAFLRFMSAKDLTTLEEFIRKTVHTLLEEGFADEKSRLKKSR